MTGYQEMLTDPSYHGQILTLTTSHVGQVGINSEDAESDRIWARALIVQDLDLDRPRGEPRKGPRHGSPKRSWPSAGDSTPEPSSATCALQERSPAC